MAETNSTKPKVPKQLMASSVSLLGWKKIHPDYRPVAKNDKNVKKFNILTR